MRRIKKKKPKIQIQTTIPIDYKQKMKSNNQELIDKCDQLQDNFSRNDIMISLQFFSDNRYWICEICKNDNLILMLYDLSLEQFRQLISVISVYLKGSGCLCYYVLEVFNDLLLIIYTYQLTDEQRFLLVEVHDELLSKIDIIQKDIETHKIFLTKGLEFQIKLIKLVLINSRTNTKEQQNILKSIASSAFSSLLSLSISENFMNALFDFAQYLLIEKYNQFSCPIQTCQIYYFFFLLKWSIIKNIQEQNIVNKQIANLQLGYEQYVQNSNNWIVHFCWINTISDLISYRQIISKSMSLKNQDDIKQKQLWNELIKQEIIQVLPYDKYLGKVNNSCSFKSIDYETEQILNGQGLKKMKLFQNAIVNQQLANKQNFFQFYLDFTFQKLKQPDEKNNLPPRFELFGADEQMKKLQRLYQLLKEIKEKISEQYIESQVESFPQLSQEVEAKNNVNQYDLVLDKEGEVQQLEFSLFKLSYLLHEVDFTMIIEKKRIEICQEKFKLHENQNQKDKHNQNKKDQNKQGVQQKQLENIYNEWINLDFPINTLKFLISLQNKEYFTSNFLKLQKQNPNNNKSQFKRMIQVYLFVMFNFLQKSFYKNLIFNNNHYRNFGGATISQQPLQIMNNKIKKQINSYLISLKGIKQDFLMMNTIKNLRNFLFNKNFKLLKIYKNLALKYKTISK